METTDETELFNYMLSNKLITLGWIHTHPKQVSHQHHFHSYSRAPPPPTPPRPWSSFPPFLREMVLCFLSRNGAE